jgi:hypothetical protein
VLFLHDLKKLVGYIQITKPQKQTIICKQKKMRKKEKQKKKNKRRRRKEKRRI